MRPVRLLLEVEEELQDTVRFYEAEQQGLGRALIQEVRRACQFIAEHPLAARIERGDVRVKKVAAFPYRIYYQVRPDEILIIAIGHRRRRPGFWRRRW